MQQDQQAKENLSSIMKPANSGFIIELKFGLAC